MKKKATSKNPIQQITKYEYLIGLEKHKERISSELTEIFQLYPEYDYQKMFKDDDGDTMEFEMNENDITDYRLTIYSFLSLLSSENKFSEGFYTFENDILPMVKRPFELSKMLTFELSKMDKYLIESKKTDVKRGIEKYLEHEFDLYQMVKKVFV